MSYQLQCGAGKADITPPLEMARNLQGLGPQNITGILDPLYVRVIAFASGNDKAMLISVDLDKAPDHDEILDAVSKHTGVPTEAILYFGIHTHTAPVMGYRPFERQDKTKWSQEEIQAFDQYSLMIKESILKAAGIAIDNLQPVRLGVGHGKSYINVNRCCHYEIESEDGQKKDLVEIGFNGEGPVDRDVTVIRIENFDSEVISCFVNYACHNVVMFLHDAGDGGIHISHDIGGAVSLELEKRYPGSVAIWSSGAAGNINPIMATQNYFPLKGTIMDLSPFRSFEMSIMLRDRLAGRHLLDILEINKKIECVEQSGYVASAIKYIAVPEEEQTEDPWSHSRIRLHLLQIGDIAFIGVNGELFSTLGEIIRKNSKLKETVVINHDCSLMLDNPGYILDDETNELCRKADIVRLPHGGFKAHKGYLPEQLAVTTKELFKEARCDLEV